MSPFPSRVEFVTEISPIEADYRRTVECLDGIAFLVLVDVDEDDDDDYKCFIKIKKKKPAVIMMTVNLSLLGLPINDREMPVNELSRRLQGIKEPDLASPPRIDWF
ncbi:hypothetical protein RRG08_050813 [Elysia crispata]|uniref:Uncharacterized protein n=1 Tax=Elysia crispata TaxID=231223 RepID=A0AAE1DWZ7_9GAST|nr:hypothetical protein RRG08_050813 [Elysia crispata]